MTAFNNHGPWHNSGQNAMKIALPIAYFNQCGLTATLNELKRFRQVGIRNRRWYVNRMPGGVRGKG